jgi:hypothetical protein
MNEDTRHSHMFLRKKGLQQQSKLWGCILLFARFSLASFILLFDVWHRNNCITNTNTRSSYVSYTTLLNKRRRYCMEGTKYWYWYVWNRHSVSYLEQLHIHVYVKMENSSGGRLGCMFTQLTKWDGIGYTNRCHWGTYSTSLANN